MKTEEPVRLLEGGTADPVLRSALEAGRDELPSLERLQAIGARLGVGTGGAVTGGGTGAAPLAGVSLGAKLVGLALVAGAVAGGVGLALHFRSRPDPAPAAAVQPAPPLAADAPAPTPLPIFTQAPAPAPPLDPPRQAPKVPPPVRASRAEAHAGDPRAEAALLQQANDALAADPGRALKLCAVHVQRYPSGLLSQEREVIAIEALVGLGRRAEATERADRFRAAHPESSHLRRIEQVLSP
jgi:hypothetical protein